MKYTTFEYLQLTVTIIALLLQAYIIYLISVATPKTMNNYKYFLVFFTAWDLLFSLFTGLLMIPIPAEPLMGVVVRGLAFYIGPLISSLTPALCIYAGTMVLLSQNYCLVYRFTILLPNQKIHERFLSIKCKFWCFLGFQILAFALGVGLHQTQSTQIEAREHLAWYSKAKPKAVAETFQYIEEGETLWVIKWSNYSIGYMCTVLLLIILSEMTSAGLIFVTLRALKRTGHVHSVATKKLTIQFIRLLAAQMFLPLIFVGLPAMAAIVCTISDIWLDRESISYGYFLLSCYSGCNMTLTLVFISPYRTHFFAKILWPVFIRPMVFVFNGFKKPNEPQAVSHVNTIVSASTVL
ncbi:hypothetical protein M3Y94_01251000 [Aphelenchoides besseyi]|nr:hypothetical protein M3Y94_01251000 [Aphelenchoides besseyi]KAI6219411.1 hypothetical protein M3Y95_01108200 [Aphelenchoides besseyi]